jgi:hypothetical protein
MEFKFGGPIPENRLKDLNLSGPFKVCSKCNIEKDCSLFSFNRRKGILMSKCKQCDSEYHKEARRKKALERNPRPVGPYGKFSDPRYGSNRTRVIRYGIGPEDYDEMFINQQGCCAICNKHQLDLKRKLSVDHNHSTGIVRGLLCDECNLGLGKFRDSVGMLKDAILYLETNRTKR